MCTSGHTDSGISAYLQRDAVFHEQLLGEQPSPRHSVTDIAGVGVDGVQGFLASSVFPDLVQRDTAAAGAAVLRLEVQPLGSGGVSDRYGGARVALRLGDGVVRRLGVSRGG